MSVKKQNVVITGGGTGGHIYPGLALAERLKKEQPHVQVHFVGAVGGIEESIVPKHGYPLHLLKVGRLHHSVGKLRRILGLLTLPLAFLHSIFLYLKLRPRWVLGIGGFASGPFLLMASLLGGNTALLEPNAFPGMANRLLSKYVRLCFVVFEETKKFFPANKSVPVGLPVRLRKKNPSMTYDQTRPFQILIFGGSQGARAVNNLVGDWVESLSQSQRASLRILHQVGARDYDVWKERYSDKFADFLEYTGYIDNMPEKLDWADLVICRSGIGSVAEVAMAGKPAIFIPLPTAADNHQVKNAEVLSNDGAAILLEEKDAGPGVLGGVISSLQEEPQKLASMMKGLKSFDYSKAQEQLLRHLEQKELS